MMIHDLLNYSLGQSFFILSYLWQHITSFSVVIYSFLFFLFILFLVIALSLLSYSSLSHFYINFSICVESLFDCDLNHFTKVSDGMSSGHLGQFKVNIFLQSNWDRVLLRSSASTIFNVHPKYFGGFLVYWALSTLF